MADALDPFVRALLDALEVGVFFTDRSGIVTRWSLPAARISGVEPSEAIGRRVPDGLTIPTTIEPVLDERGTVLGTVGILHPPSRPAGDEARLDPLTGLANRRALDEALDAARPPFSVILADLDRFKRVNDTQGHPAGDRALRASAKILRAGCRSGDTVGRLGGDEFLIVLPGALLADASQVAERLRSALATGPVTASFGVAESRPGETPGDLVARADAALYRAKAEGRDRVRHGPDDRHRDSDSRSLST